MTGVSCQEAIWAAARERAFTVAAAADPAFLAAIRPEIERLLETGTSFPEAERVLRKVAATEGAA